MELHACTTILIDPHFPDSSTYRYRFNEAAGSAQVIDYSGNGFHAAAFHGPSFSGSSMGLRWGQYLSIDTALAPVIKTLDSYTVTFNVRIPQWSSTRPRVFNFGTSDDLTSMALFPYDWAGPYGITYYTTGPDIKGEQWCRTRSLPIDHNTFYAMAVTYDGPSATFRTYRDGEETGACHDFPFKPSAQPLCTQLFIGRSTHSVYHEYFNSEFRCFRMYGRALSAEEIRRDPCCTGVVSSETSVPMHDVAAEGIETAEGVIYDVTDGETQGDIIESIQDGAMPVQDDLAEAPILDAATSIADVFPDVGADTVASGALANLFATSDNAGVRACARVYPIDAHESDMDFQLTTSSLTTPHHTHHTHRWPRPRR